MIIQHPPPCDPAQMAATVRSLARHAHRLLRDPNSPPAEAQLLAARIAQFQDWACDQASDELVRWLEDLHRRVETQALETSRATSTV
ncbi:MAG: hypothetical protein ABI353_19250 [Isosphaeraceae bacterium]